MSLKVTPHLNFNGNARSALNFYNEVFSGSLSILSYADAGAAQQAIRADNVIWGQVTTESGFRLMAYDVQTDRVWHPGENSAYVVLEGDDPDEIAGYWQLLSAGAVIMQPLAPSAWSPLYGMLRDRFGISWVISTTSPSTS